MGNIKIVEAFVNCNHPDVNLNADMPDDTFPLYLAVKLDNAEMVSTLLKSSKIDATKTTSFRTSAFLLAISSGKIAIIQAFLDASQHRDALLNLRTEASIENLIYEASLKGRENELTELLFDKKVNSSQTVLRGFSSLHSATMLGQTHVVELLLEAGFGWDVRTYDGISCLELARAMNDIAMIKIFQRHSLKHQLQMFRTHTQRSELPLQNKKIKLSASNHPIFSETKPQSIILPTQTNFTSFPPLKKNTSR